LSIPSSPAPPPARGLTSLQLFMMSFGAIVGVGWITILGQWLTKAGPGGSVIALAIGAAAILCVAANYGLLARRDLLSVGGEIGAIDGTLGQGASFIAIAALALACVSVVAFEAVSAGWIIVTLVPVLEGPSLYQVFGRDVHLGTVLIAVGGIFLVAALNLRSLSNAASAQNAIVFLKIGVTAVFCLAGLLRGEAANLQPLLQKAGDGGVAISGILAVAATMPLWYAGFNVTALLTGERDSSVGLEKVGRVMYTSILASGVFYICVVLAASSVMPWSGLVSAQLPAAAAFREGLGSATLANLVLVAGLLGIFSAWIACYAGAVRVLTALRRQLGHGGSGLARGTGPVIPARSTILTVAVVAIVLSLAGRAALVPIVNVAALCYGVVYLLVSIVAWRHAADGRERLVAALGAVVSAFMSSYVIYSTVQEGGWNAPEATVTVLWVAIAGSFWLFRKKRLSHGK
jgi:amino acid transporter